MRVTLLGTGDSTGTPTPGCDCDTCQTAIEKGLERSRFSVHLSETPTGESLLIDASPDFRQQFLTHDVPLPDAAVITHIHFDHLDGLGNAYRLLRSLPVYAADTVDPVTGESVAETIRRRYDYLDAVTVLDQEPGEPVQICGLTVKLLPVSHPPLVSYGLEITDPRTGARLGITGDTNFDIPAATRDALTGVDLLLADGIVPADVCEWHPAGGSHERPDGVPRTFGTKHMTREGALDLAARLEADRTRLVHLSHHYPADEAFSPPLAVDGETMVLE